MLLSKADDGISGRPVIPVLFGMNRPHLHGIFRREAVELLGDQLRVGARQVAQTNRHANRKIIFIIVFPSFGIGRVLSRRFLSCCMATALRYKQAQCEKDDMCFFLNPVFYGNRVLSIRNVLLLPFPGVADPGNFFGRHPSR